MKFLKSKNEKDEEVIVPDVPATQTSRLFVVTISALERTKKPKLKTKYIDREAGKLIDSWSRDEAKEYEEVLLFEGEFEHSDRTDEIFRQERETLDIADLALYINRAR